jgi:aminoacyl tRNA synthase complex-interacting multifunctional protein 1
MANSSTDNLHFVLQKSFPSIASSLSENSTKSVQDTNTAIGGLSSTIYPRITYSDTEKAEIDQWLTTSARLVSPSEDPAKLRELLKTLNAHLSSRTTLLGTKPSIADIALYARLAPAVSKWTPEERTGENGHHHIVRYIDFVQNAPVMELKLDGSEKVHIDANDIKFTPKPVDAKEEKELK